MASRNNRARLVALVKQEAAKLRESTTQAEKDKLRPEKIWSRSQVNCIYGQLTGGCFSPRAHELLIQCAPRVYEFCNGPMGDAPLAPVTKSIKLAIKGREKSPQKSYYYSPIEIWLCKVQPEHGLLQLSQVNQMITTLVKYIKGEADDLGIR